MGEILSINDTNITRAGDALRGGGLVAMPTETVYGLAADATNGQAVARIYEAKGRPSFNPLIIHVSDLDDAQKWGQFNAAAIELARAFWPGPLTLVVPKTEGATLSDLVTAGLDSIAIRVPAHPAAQDLIKAAGVPLAAPSANKSGSISPTSPAHVHDSLGGAVDYILAGGSCAVGLESTIIDCTRDAPSLLRPGGITAEQIALTLDMDESALTLAASDTDDTAPKSPGLLLKHYAPSIPVRLKAYYVKQDEALLAFGSTKFMSVEGGGALTDLPDTQMQNLSEGGDLYEAAANLFAMMRALDNDAGHKRIAVMDVPDIGLGAAINDRLRRAAS